MRYSREQLKSLPSFQIECKEAQRVKDGVRIKGFASTPDIDRYDDIVDPKAFASGLKNFMKNPVMLRSHNPDIVVGKFLTSGDDAPVITESGLQVVGVVTDKDIADKVLNGELRTLSIGFIAKTVDFDFVGIGKFDKDGQELLKEVRIIKDIDLIEISIVSTPANPNAIFTVEKSVKSYLQSLPNTIMTKKCSVYPELEAKYKLGDRFLSQKAVDEMEFKGDEESQLEEIETEELDDTTEEVETQEEKTEEADEKADETDESEEEETIDESETVETEDESASAEDETEEVESEDGEEKLVLSDEVKQRIALAKDVIHALETGTPMPEKTAEEAKAIAADPLVGVVKLLAESHVELQSQMKTVIEVLQNAPDQKGKTLIALKDGTTGSAETKGKSFLSMFSAAMTKRGE